MKKTLIIDMREGGDWSLDLLFAGLVKNLGYENVIDFPFKKKHREWKGSGDWGAERRSLGFTADNSKAREYSFDEVMKEIRSGNIERVFLDERHESHEMYLKLRLSMFNIPVVVVAGHDRFWNESPWHVASMYKNCEAMFLDNWRPEYSEIRPKAPPFHQYTWSANFEHLCDPALISEWQKDKIYDVSFFGYNSHPNRERYMNFIEICPDLRYLKKNFIFERRPGTTEVFIQKPEYFKMMAQSKICLNLRGAAENGKTLRSYEIPYVGSLMLTELTDAIESEPRSFTDGLNCLTFDSEEQLKDKLLWAFELPETREAIAENGHDFLMKYHNVKFRVKEMLEKLNG